MCLVETGTRDEKTGRISMLPKLVPACNTLVRGGTVVVTQTEKVQRARAMVEEDLLLRHPIDCPICDKAGECSLQDFHFKYGQEERRADVLPFTSRRRDVGSNVTLFVDRCVMCSRCVRFTREISGTSELMVVERGSHEEIEVLPGFPLANKLSGNVVDLCPVGALCDKEFLYRQRVWYMKSHAGVCTGCATGCSTWIDENQDRIYRCRPRENALVNQWWICNDGRYDYPHVHDDRRLAAPRRREHGTLADVDWGRLPAELDRDLRGAGRLAAVLSPFLTVEEAYLLGKYVRQIDPQARLCSDRFRSSARTSGSKTGSRSRPRNAPTAAEWNWSSRISRARLLRWTISSRTSSAAKSAACGSPAGTNAPGSTTPRPSGWGKPPYWCFRTCSRRRSWNGPRMSCPPQPSLSGTAPM